MILTSAYFNAFRKAIYALLVLLMSAFLALSAADKPENVSSEFSGGLCLYIDAAAKDIMTTAKSGSFLVHALNSAEAQTRSIRVDVAAAGLAPFVLAETWLEIPKLPYEKNHVTVMVVNNFPKLLEKGLSIDDVVRTLVPLGKASLGGVQESDRAAYEAALKKSGISEFELKDGCLVFQKPWQEGMGTWTHGQQGPDGKPVANDSYLGVPNQIQWITGNGHKKLGSLISTRVGGGRAFYFYKYAIVARDAGSGVILWTRSIGRAGAGVLTENGDILIRDPDDKGWTPKVALISGATGKTIHKFGKSGFPGPYEDGIVLAGTSGEVAIHDASTGKKLWGEKYKGKHNKPSRANFKQRRGIAPEFGRLMAGGALYSRYDSGLVVARHARTGEVIWEKNLKEVLGGDFGMHFIDGDKIIVRVEIRGEYIGKVGGGMVSVEDIHKGVIRFAAVSTKDGSLLWKHDLNTLLAPSYRGQVYKASGLIWFCRHEKLMPDSLEITDDPKVNKKIFGRYMNDPNPALFIGLNPETGAVEKTLTMPKQVNYHCYQLTVTDRYYTGNRPYYFVDWKTGELEGRFGAVRSPCDGIGHFAAQGLWFARGSYGCGCIRTVMSALGTYSASDEPSWDGAVSKPEHPLIKGAADMPSAEAPMAGDWPMYRGDHARSAASKAKISDEVSLIWHFQPEDKNILPDSPILNDWKRKNLLADKKVSQPTVANGRVFVSLLETKSIFAIDVATGKTIWNHRLPAMADSSPTLYKGLALVGCHDGWVYALRADNGEEVWRLRIAPAERRVVAYGQLESSWPVIGGVIIVNDIAYAIAGRTSEVDGGLYVLAFDTAGRVLWEGRRYLYNPGNVGPADSGRHRDSVTGAADMLASDGRLIAIGRKVSGKRSCFDATTGKDIGETKLKYSAIPFGTNRLYSGSFTGLSFVGKQEYSATKPVKKLNKKKEVVSQKPGSIFKKGAWKVSSETAEPKAIAASAERLYVAVTDADKSELWILSTQDGKKMKTLALPASPVVDGLSLSNNKIHVALEDGSIACFGLKE